MTCRAQWMLSFPGLNYHLMGTSSKTNFSIQHNPGHTEITSVLRGTVIKYSLKEERDTYGFNGGLNTETMKLKTELEKKGCRYSANFPFTINQLFCLLFNKNIPIGVRYCARHADGLAGKGKETSRPRKAQCSQRKKRCSK